MAGTITENEYNEALKNKYSKVDPGIDALLEVNRGIETDTRRIRGYKSKIKEAEERIRLRKQFRTQLIIGAVREGEPITTIAWAAGVARDTVYKILKRVDNTEQ